MFLNSVLVLVKKLKNNYFTSYYHDVLSVFKKRRAVKRKERASCRPNSQKQ